VVPDLAVGFEVPADVLVADQGESRSGMVRSSAHSGGAEKAGLILVLAEPG
jgi:hypothetical protein